MKTEKQNNITFVPLNEIEVGEVFEYNNQVYMAIDEVHISFYDENCNAIHLESADFICIPYDAQVIPLPDAKLIY